MTDPALPWRPEFLDALRMLALVSEGMAARGLPRPVLVGGGAVEFYTGSTALRGHRKREHGRAARAGISH